MAHPKPPSPTDPKHSEARAAMGMAAVISVAEDDKTIKAARVGAGAAANASPATVAAAAATGTASSPAPPTSSPPSALPPRGNRPSYFTTRESSNYEAAKRLLSGGDFEATLSTIETGMKQLASFLEVNGVSGDPRVRCILLRASSMHIMHTSYELVVLFILIFCITSSY